MARVSRRKFLGSLGATGAGLALTAGTIGFGRVESAAGVPAALVPFDGPHQAGIATSEQERLFIAAFDLTTNDREQVKSLLRTWTDAARRMCLGHPVGPVAETSLTPPQDTGEALGLSPANLTVTFGVGPTFFEKEGVDRFGLKSERPSALIDLPAFAGDLLDTNRCGGDLIIQACADDAQVTFHAVRNLARQARGLAVIRWSQLGFGRTSSTSEEQATPRNLMGFKDGTNNIKAEEIDVMNEQVWVGPGDGPAWMRGGTYMVARRIRMLIEVWDRSGLADQEQTFGHEKVSGAPIGKKDEFETVDLSARDSSGYLRIPMDAHIRLANHGMVGGARILRRGYSFTDGMDTRTGQLDAGLFFICFQRDPERGFVAIQRNLASDKLNEYIQHNGSAIFAIPPGVDGNGYWGQTLVEG
ncbi:MAG: iron uptake transporter deferrochelatase/peroxidase subunit [Nitrolancea sp.]